MMTPTVPWTERDPVALPPLVLSADETGRRHGDLLALARSATGLTFAETLERWGAPPPAPLVPYRDKGLNPHQRLLADAVTERGLSAEAVAGQSVTRIAIPFTALRIDAPGGTIIYHQQFLSWTGADGRANAAINGPATFDLLNKGKTKQMLAAAGAPVPRGAVFRRDSLADALTYAADFTSELCVKPVDAANGVLVFPCLRTAEDIRDACLAVSAAMDSFLIEESVAGEAWRFFYVRPDIVGIKLGRPASVVGNGFNTVRELTDIANAARARKAVPGHSGPLGDEDAHRALILRRQGVSEDFVPQAAQRIFLSSLSNGSRGADSLARPAVVNRKIVDRVRQAIEVFDGVQAVAADVILTDPGDPDTPLSIIEINAAPSLLAYHHPAEGPIQDVAGAVADLLVTLRRT